MQRIVGVAGERRGEPRVDKIGGAPRWRLLLIRDRAAGGCDAIKRERGFNHRRLGGVIVPVPSRVFFTASMTMRRSIQLRPDIAIGLAAIGTCEP